MEFAIEFAFFVLVGTIVISSIIGLCQVYKREKMWNDGICKKTGNPWVEFGITEKGNIGYKSHYTDSPNFEILWR